MKTIVGLLLVATVALSYPLGEAEDKPAPAAPAAVPAPSVPLVIADYSTVTKAEDKPAAEPAVQQDSNESSSSSSSEESSERPVPPSEAPLLPSTTPQPPVEVSTQPAPVEDKREEKKEEPKLIPAETPIIKEELKKIEEEKPLIPTPTEEIKKEELLKPEQPAVKSILEASGSSDVVQVAKSSPAVAEESSLPVAAPAPAPASLPAEPVLKTETPALETGLAATSGEKIEKPLALPALKAEPIETPASILQEKSVVVPEPTKEPELIAEKKPELIVEKKPELIAEEKIEKKAKAEEVVPAATTEAAKVELPVASTLPPQPSVASSSTTTEQLPESSPSSPSS